MGRSVAVEKRVEGERPFWAFAGDRQLVAAVVRIEQARLARLSSGRGIGLNSRNRLLPRGGRRQIERPLAPASGKQERGSPHQDKCPSSMVRAVVPSHVKNPQCAGRTIQKLIRSGETCEALNFR